MVDLKWVGEKRTVGREIYLNDRRAVQLSDDESVGVMCMDASALIELYHHRRIRHVIASRIRVPRSVSFTVDNGYCSLIMLTHHSHGAAVSSHS